MQFNLDQKVFLLRENTDNGAVSSETVFQYRQKDNIVTANYSGGEVLDGQIIGQFIKENQLDLRYHCVMQDKTIKVGKAIARLSQNRHGLIEMRLEWEWVGNNPGKGTSVYIEAE